MARNTINCPLCGALERDAKGALMHPKRDKEIKKYFNKIMSGDHKLEHTETLLLDNE